MGEEEAEGKGVGGRGSLGLLPIGTKAPIK